VCSSVEVEPPAEPPAAEASRLRGSLIPPDPFKSEPMSAKHHESAAKEPAITTALGQSGEIALTISEAAKMLPISEHSLREAVRRTGAG